MGGALMSQSACMQSTCVLCTIESLAPPDTHMVRPRRGEQHKLRLGAERGAIVCVRRRRVQEPLAGHEPVRDVGGDAVRVIGWEDGVGRGVSDRP